MSNFDHLERERVSAEQLAEWVCPRAYGGAIPVLTVRPASPSLNPAYTNAMVLAHGGSNRIQLMQQRRNVVKTAEQTRKADRWLYAKHVVVGWKGVVDVDGREVPFNEDDCKKWLGAIDAYVFDDLRGFCMIADNFADAIGDEEAEEQGNGLPPASSGS